MPMNLRPVLDNVLLKHIEEEKPKDRLIVTPADDKTNTPTGEVVATGGRVSNSVSVGDRVVYPKHSRTGVPGRDDLFLVPESALIAKLI